MQQISRDQLKTKIECGDDFLLVEVMPPASYETFHLPGAMNIPMTAEFDDKVEKAVHDKNKEIVVYSSDATCAASRAAAERLERLGYQHVYEYHEGKAEWRRAGLPVNPSSEF